MHTLFVFVQCELGRTYEVAAKLVDEIEGVAEVYSISGEYDLLVKAHPPADAGVFVTQILQRVPGVQRTSTVLAFNAFTPSGI